MPVRTDVLLLDNRLYVPATSTILSTVPAGEVWLVRTVTLWNQSAVAAALFRLGIFRSPTEYPLLELAAAAQRTARADGTFLVFEAGDQVRGFVDIAANMRIGLFGARLVV